MVLDLLLLLIIVILIISIEEKNISNYKLDISNKNNDLNLLKESIIVEQLVSDCNFLAIKNEYTHVCYKNQISIKNLDFLPYNVCRISMDNLVYFKKGEVENIHKRGVIYNNAFEVLEVGFCE